MPAIGDTFAGKYCVERMLGVGGMGVVVAARHVKLGQEVAVKFLLPESLRVPGATDRFLREAQAALQIHSEHVARILDVGTLEDGLPFMVMELLNGIDLGELIGSNGPLPVGSAIDYVLQTCEAMAEAHALGIVHRDLKPSNLFLIERADGSPLVKVLDFGIAKAKAEGPNPALTATGIAMGSPQYMSPEQLRDSKNVDLRSDVWALGIILYELMTGRVPFEGESAPAVCAAIAADPPIPLRRLLSDAPADLEAVILGCLEKRPALRIPDVAALARALEPFAHASSRISIERVIKTIDRGREGGIQSSSKIRQPTAPNALGATVPSRPDQTPADAHDGSPLPLMTATSPSAASIAPPSRLLPKPDIVNTRSAWNTGIERGSPRRIGLAAAAALGLAALAVLGFRALHRPDAAPSRETFEPVRPSSSEPPIPELALSGAPEQPTSRTRSPDAGELEGPIITVAGSPAPAVPKAEPHPHGGPTPLPESHTKPTPSIAIAPVRPPAPEPVKAPPPLDPLSERK